jgi:hypothetical protein
MIAFFRLLIFVILVKSLIVVLEIYSKMRGLSTLSSYLMLCFSLEHIYSACVSKRALCSESYLSLKLRWTS